MEQRIPYTVFWLDAHGFVILSHYFETSSRRGAYRKVSVKMQKLRQEKEVCGYLLLDASVEVSRRFFHKEIDALKQERMMEIESHLYAPPHLLRSKSS